LLVGAVARVAGHVGLVAEARHAPFITRAAELAAREQVTARRQAVVARLTLREAARLALPRVVAAVVRLAVDVLTAPLAVRLLGVAVTRVVLHVGLVAEARGAPAIARAAELAVRQIEVVRVGGARA